MRSILYINIIIGAWLIISPFLFGETYHTAVFWSSEVAGVMLVVIGVVFAVSVPRKSGNEHLSEIERRKAS